ncbi:MAG: RNA repair transcriptional activator RtcR family protein [Candidatus Hydrogenedentota bacterium]
MTTRNVLITCFGKNDQRGLEPPADDPGPLLNLLRQRQDMDAVHILVDDPEMNEAVERLKAQLATDRPSLDVTAHTIHVAGPHDYEGVYVELRREAGGIAREEEGASLWINVSSGFPVFQVVWFLLAYSGQIPARLLHARRPNDVERYGGAPVHEVAIQLDAFPRIEAPYGKAFLESELHRLERAQRASLEDLQAKAAPVGLFFESEAMADIVRRLLKYAPHRESVLLLGESGVGKELLARLLHRYSSEPPREDALESVNCGALPEGLLESELFGHEKGAFTGANHQRKGAFELAAGGTLFLDEIGEASPRLQTALLRTLQEKKIRRVGGSQDIPVDVRVVAATNADPWETLREDLYYRLETFKEKIPPLRERPQDILPLAWRFIRQQGKDPREMVTSEFENALLRRTWPGNIRQLQSAITHAVIMAEEGQRLTPDLLRDPDGDLTVSALKAHIPPEGIDLDARLEEIKEAYIAEAMRQAEDNTAEASRLLGYSPRALSNRRQRKQR